MESLRLAHKERLGLEVLLASTPRYADRLTPANLVGDQRCQHHR